MRKSEMPAFIQAMYGTILGVSFYKIVIPGIGKLTFAATQEEISRFFQSPSLFKLVLFSFTLIIVAHDWFSYHKYKKESKYENEYWMYLPQTFALFFLSQMFVAIDLLKFQYWFAFAFWYTLCNILDFFLPDSKEKFKQKLLSLDAVKYLIHLILTIVFFFKTGETYSTHYYIPFIITLFVVIALWFVKEKREHAKVYNVKTIEQSDIIAAAEAKAKNARDNAWMLLLKPLEDLKQQHEETEEKICKAESDAKSGRDKIILELNNSKQKILELESELDKYKKA